MSTLASDFRSWPKNASHVCAELGQLLQCDKNVQFETPTRTGQAEYFELINACAHLDSVQNQDYKFGQALSKSDLKIRPKFSPNGLLCTPLMLRDIFSFSAPLVLSP